MRSGFITIIFCLPTANPVTSQTLKYVPSIYLPSKSPLHQLTNHSYTVVAVGIIAIFSLLVWFLSARKWFVGPQMEIKEAQRLGVNILEPGALEDAEEKEKEKKSAEVGVGSA